MFTILILVARPGSDVNSRFVAAWLAVARAGREEEADEIR
jgi:hypothetical protein